MKICYLGIEERRQYLQAAAAPGTVVENMADYIPKNPKPISIESLYEEYLSAARLFEMVVEAERRGYDAVLTGCFGDPGVDAARELVSIPVIGPGEASFHTACMLGYRFSVICPVESTIRSTRMQAVKAGLESRLASLRSLNEAVVDIRKGEESTYQKLLGLSKACIEMDGADVVILGCASVAFAFGDRLAKVVDFPVINGLKLSLKIAEMLVGTGLSHSKIAFPLPPKLAAVAFEPLG